MARIVGGSAGAHAAAVAAEQRRLRHARLSRQGAGGTDLSQLAASQKAAQAANLKRYQQGLSTLKSGYAAAIGQAQQFGTAALQGIEESAVQQRATGEQDLISRGLGGTTIRGAMTRGVERERMAGRARIGEQKAMLLGGLAQQRATAISGFIERRQDVGPDMGMFANLIQSAQQSGGGGGGGGVTRAPSAPDTGLDVFGRPKSAMGKAALEATRLQQERFKQQTKQMTQQQQAPRKKAREPDSLAYLMGLKAQNIARGGFAG